MDFIRAANGKFWEGNRRFRYVGGNHYPLVQSAYSMTVLDSFFFYCQLLGIRVVRFWCFNKTGPASNASGFFRYLSGGALLWREQTFIDLDKVMDSARRHGIRLTLVMADNWPEFNNWGHKQEYCYWSNTIYGTAYDRYNYGADFHADTNIKTWYKQFLSQVATRRNTINGILYSQDPTIFSVELMNEARCVIGSDSNPNTVNSYRLGVLTSWYSEVSAYAKSVFPNTLIGTGSQAQFLDYANNDQFHNGTYYGGDYTTQHQLPNIDYFDFHWYPFNDVPATGMKAWGQGLGYPNTPTRAGFEAQLHQFVSIAKASGKPVKFGEIGTDKRMTAATVYPIYPRKDFWSALLNTWFNVEDGDGGEIWHISASATGMDDNNYNDLLDTPHTGGNKNNNLNDDDSGLNQVFKFALPLYFDKFTPQNTSYANKYH